MFQRFFPRPKLKQPLILSYNQPEEAAAAGVVQSVMEWLCASLMNVGYFKQSHLFWFTQAMPSDFGKAVAKALRKDEPVFLYRCNEVRPEAPSGHYWRLMPEHPSLRLYQLEVEADD